MKNLLKSFQLSVLAASSLYFNVMPLNASNPESKHPNIMLIMADDMGYSDLGFMGSGIKTPNIDRLAKSGVVFSQFYNTGRCCPTRASLLTGLYQHNTGMGWVLTERDESVPAWDSLTENEKKIWDARMAVYAAQIDRMDQGVGQIIETLKRNKELDNTIIIFLSDNGGCDEEQGGDLKMDDLPFLGNETPAQSYRTNWANVSNTPFREYKHYVHEGGISTPLIVNWPEKITSKGAITKQVGHVIDLMPTILEIAGANYPEKFNGSIIHQLQGKSLVPCFNGTVFKREPIYFEHQANRAVINGDWKLVSKATQQPPWEGEWKLYNLKDDRTETKNLIGQQPVRAHKLEKLWNKWATENHVYPLDNRGWFEKIKASVGPPNQ